MQRQARIIPNHPTMLTCHGPRASHRRGRRQTNQHVSNVSNLGAQSYAREPGRRGDSSHSGLHGCTVGPIRPPREG